MGGWDVFRVPAAAGATPVRVTKYEDDSDHWEKGGEAVSCYLGDGHLAYYVGWFITIDDKDMHVMAAAPNQVENFPLPSVLHTFNGSVVGLGANNAASPDALSISGDGMRAVIS